MTGLCRFFGNFYGRHPDIAQWRSEFEKLHLTRTEISTLYRQFREMVTYGEDVVFVVRVFDLYKVSPSFLNRKFFLLQGEDLINFRTFVYCVWNTCTLTRELIVCSLLRLFKRHEDNIMVLLTSLLGDKGLEDGGNLMFTIYDDMKECFSDNASLEQRFFALCDTYPCLVDEVLDMQRKIIANSLGDKFWASQSLRRNCTSKLDRGLKMEGVQEKERSSLASIYASTEQSSFACNFSELQSDMLDGNEIQNLRDSIKDVMGMNHTEGQGSFRGETFRVKPSQRRNSQLSPIASGSAQNTTGSNALEGIQSVCSQSGIDLYAGRGSGERSGEDISSDLSSLTNSSVGGIRGGSSEDEPGMGMVLQISRLTRIRKKPSPSIASGPSEPSIYKRALCRTAARVVPVTAVDALQDYETDEDTVEAAMNWRKSGGGLSGTREEYVL